VARLGQNKAGLAALDPEAAGEQLGIVIALERCSGVDLSVQDLQFGRVRRGLPAVAQLERYVGRGHDHLLRSACRTTPDPLRVGG
jgi:hypothetical protein